MGFLSDVELRGISKCNDADTDGAGDSGAAQRTVVNEVGLKTEEKRG